MKKPNKWQELHTQILKKFLTCNNFYLNQHLEIGYFELLHGLDDVSKHDLEILEDTFKNLSEEEYISYIYSAIKELEEEKKELEYLLL